MIDDAKQNQKRQKVMQRRAGEKVSTKPVSNVRKRRAAMALRHANNY